MPQVDPIEELYVDAKGLRSCETGKQLRRLRVFERVNYKKTFTVKKHGHNLEDIHRLDDGGLRHTVTNLSYSLNKKKRWLLPGIIEQRILEHVPHVEAPTPEKNAQLSTIDERLKIVMYENENIRHASTCIRYANSQAEPHVLYKHGRRFNSTTLTKWINFDNRHRWNARRRPDDTDRVNRPNFGFQQRPGFFPSEVTYEFLYPRRLPPSATHKTGKSTLLYSSNPHDTYNGDSHGRHHKDTNKNRRRKRRSNCVDYDLHEREFRFEEDNVNEEEIIAVASKLLDETDKWSIVFDDADERYSASTDFPIDYFIPSISKRTSYAGTTAAYTIPDYKAYKYFEPPPPPPAPVVKPSIVNEELLCVIPCASESDFLALMQQSAVKTSQANLSPATFLQRTSASPFSIIYTYCRTSSTVKATVKYTDICPMLMFDKANTTLEQLVEYVSQKLNEYANGSKANQTGTKSYRVDELRGSLPLPMTILQRMLLVRPHSTDKQTALQNEHLHLDERGSTGEWFDTTSNEYEMVECSICCDVLTANDAYQLLPCKHTVCQACMASYIRTSVSSATYSSSSTSSVTCFQPECSTQLNAALLQAFLSFDIYHLYIEALMDRQLFSSGKYRKCPSPACSSLLLVGGNANQSSMCSCGQRVCLNCFEEFHFPATCRQFKVYVETLRKSGDDLLSIAKVGENSSCYIAEGKNCPNCGEFVEKNGGCPHMTCKCGNEYCWMCLKPWSSHNYATCMNVPESVHELRSSTRNRLHNKAVSHRRQRNQFAFDGLSSAILRSKLSAPHHDVVLSTYIDLNTLAEFLYVLLQRRRTDIYIRAVLGQTANRLAWDASQIKLQVECQNIKIDHINQMRYRLQRTLLNLLHMKKIQILV